MKIDRSVSIPTEQGELIGDLAVPPGASGLVVFAHGSGSSRLSPRNRQVARTLNDAGLATLLVDLLTADEEAIDLRTGRIRFDIDLLTMRVGEVIAWAHRAERLRDLQFGLFGASTGAAAALATAAIDPASVHAVVSRGGRPDLAGELLDRVQAPTLLVVGSRDTEVLELNELSAQQLNCEHRVAIVPGATHLFEEPGTLDQVAELAASWFARHLGSVSAVTELHTGASPRSGPYSDRGEAGEVLARAVMDAATNLVDPLVVALPRGGVEVAIPVANALAAPMEIVVSRKVGVPFQPELALGAVDEDGKAVIDDRLRRSLHVSHADVRDLTLAAFTEAQQRAKVLRNGRPPTSFAGRDIVLVDDGYATGMTAIAAARYLKRHGARRVILAVPLAPRELVSTTHQEFDQVVCPYTPEPFRAVGIHYRRFDQVPDAVVRRLLQAHGPGSSIRGAHSAAKP